MKIGCDACEQAAAAVLCCADEAALCRRCDAAVHSANRLAGKHHRVALLHPSPSTSTAAGADDDDHHPACDICQERTGYFFCLEDRALLCRTCDVAVHTATPHVAAHRRFLITGVRIGGSVVDDAAGVFVSPSSGSGDSSIVAPAAGGSASCSRNVAADRNGRSPAAPATAVRFAPEGDGTALEQQWPWSEALAAADDIGVGAAMELCYTGIYEPGSFSLTG